MPFKLGPLELIIILVIIFIIFGAGKLPQLFDAVGRGVNKLRKKAQSDPDLIEDQKKDSKKSESKKKEVVEDDEDEDDDDDEEEEEEE